MRQNVLFDRLLTWFYVMAIMIGCIMACTRCILLGTRAKPGNHLPVVVYIAIECELYVIFFLSFFLLLVTLSGLWHGKTIVFLLHTGINRVVSVLQHT